jgi:two-component system sensor histidine kinase/response regulator
MDMNMPVGELETLARVITFVAGLAGLGWAFFGVLLKISRSAALYFSAANFLLVVGDVAAQFRGPDVSLLDFYQSVNISTLLILGCVFLFRAGTQELHGVRCRVGRDFGLTVLAVGLATLLGQAVGMRSPAIAAVFLTAGGLSLWGFHEGYQLLRKKSFGRSMSLALLWPYAAVGILFLLRVPETALTSPNSPLGISEAVRFKHVIISLWAQLLIFLFINASLIGHTLSLLIKKLKDQATHLQMILDTAPVGVAISTGGIIRFANPRVTELLNMQVGDAATNALVIPQTREKIVAELKKHGTVRDLEVQMYCPHQTIRDLLVTYLPTDFDGKPGVLGWMIDITELKKNEKRILFNRTVVENSEPMFWADPNTLSVVYANKAGLALMEVPAEKMVGAKIPPQFLLTLSQENMPALLDRLRDVGRPMRFETRHIRGNGEVIDVDVSCYIAEDEERSLLVASMRDISEQKKSHKALRQANDEQSAIFESATLGIAFIKDWAIVRANHRLEELFGWGASEMLGRSPRIWWTDVAAMTDGPYADIKRGEIHNSTQELLRKDGTRFWCRLSGSAIDARDLSRGTVWMFDDVTEERRAAELMRIAKELAEDATRMKSDFLANMSHEIRTPMNAIIGMSHLALQTDLNPKQRNYIEKVDAAARNLLGIINDILDFSKIEAGKLQFEATEFHLEDVMENLADLSIMKAQDKGLELLFDVGPDVPTALVGDALRLGQVLLNLVGNAIKFTERGEVTVGIHTVDFNPASHPGHIRLRFDISDTGVGLSEEQKSKLFSAFSQADASTTRKYGGTGLGLTISKRLVELIDGQIGVQSQVAMGSTFTFTARFGLQDQQRLRSTLEPDVTGLRILVVDDNARAREIMLSILASQKFDATAVESGAKAIHALEEAQDAGRPYGLVLMDWMMPDEDGLATIQRIRADPRLNGVPAFVMVTAHSRDELLEQAQATRIDGLLLKPVSPSSLLDSILCALGKEVLTRGRKYQRLQASQEAAHSVRGAYLLLVEDNPVNQELALELLQGVGIRVDVANNGAEAVRMVARAPYDGVLMDCQMPVMDGFEATRKIRADGRFDALPILAMTANAMSGDRELCMAAGMNDHIGKPIDIDQLFASLARWIKPQDPAGNLAATSGASVLAQQTDVPHIACLDIKQAMRRVGGNGKLLRKLIGRFVETQSDAMTRLQAALDAGDLDTAIREAHTTKGLAGNIGASQLLSLAGAVEAALKHGETTSLPHALAAMAQELALVISQITQALGSAASAQESSSSPASGEMVDRALLAQELQKLAALLADDDSRAGKLADSVAEKLRGVGQGTVSGQLKKLIGKYEFEEALEKLRETAQTLGIEL